MDNIRVIDCETTGTTPGRHSIFEVGLVKCPAEDRSYFRHIWRPRVGTEIDPEAMAVNGRDWRELEGLSMGWLEGMTKFLDELNEDADKLGKSLILCGWNVNFDESFLRHAWELIFPNKRCPWSRRVLDLHSVFLVYAIQNGLSSPAGGWNLSRACRAVGLKPEPEPHDALAGCRSATALLRKLLAPVDVQLSLSSSAAG